MDNPQGPNQGQVPPPPAQSSPLLKGCLIVLLVMVVLGAIGVYFVMQNWREWAAEAVRVTSTEMLRQTPLERDEQDALIDQADRVATALGEGEIGITELDRLADGLEQSGIMGYLELRTLLANHLSPALSEDEQADAAARQQIERVGVGMQEQAIMVTQVDDALTEYFHSSPVDFEEADRHEGDAFGRWEPRDPPLTDEQARESVAALQTLADDANVPEQVEPRDIVGEVRETIDAILDD